MLAIFHYSFYRIYLFKAFFRPGWTNLALLSYPLHYCMSFHIFDLLALLPLRCSSTWANFYSFVWRVALQQWLPCTWHTTRQVRKLLTQTLRNSLIPPHFVFNFTKIFYHVTFKLHEWHETNVDTLIQLYILISLNI